MNFLRIGRGHSLLTSTPGWQLDATFRNPRRWWILLFYRSIFLCVWKPDQLVYLMLSGESPLGQCSKATLSPLKTILWWPVTCVWEGSGKSWADISRLGGLQSCFKVIRKSDGKTYALKQVSQQPFTEVGQNTQTGRERESKRTQRGKNSGIHLNPSLSVTKMHFSTIYQTFCALWWNLLMGVISTTK